MGTQIQKIVKKRSSRITAVEFIKIFAIVIQCIGKGVILKRVLKIEYESLDWLHVTQDRVQG
jgi:hypothetical protein